MQLVAEVVNKFDQPSDCSSLLYVPPQNPAYYRQTRCYSIEYEGEQTALLSFIHRVLVDSVSQELSIEESPALEGFQFYIDYGMKPHVLDLERESVLQYYRKQSEKKFVITKLQIDQRIYVFAETKTEANAFERDMVNPLIHQWKVNYA